MKEEIRQGKIAYQTEQLVKSVTFELKEYEEDAEKKGEVFVASNYQSQIFRGLVFQDGNFSFCVELMYSEEEKKEAKEGLWKKNTIDEKYQKQLFSEIWKKAIER